MVETRFDIRFFAGGEECVIASDLTGEQRQQAELVAFGHYVARIVSLLGPARAGVVVEALSGDGAPERPLGAVSSSSRVIVRFLDGATGPRMDFRLKLLGASFADASIGLLRATLLDTHEGDAGLTGRVELASELLARLAATGQIRAENEFDVALAVADVAWRSVGAGPATGGDSELVCPACHNVGGFELRVWPGADAVLRRCSHCGAGVWKRGRHAPRLIRPDIWSAMESMREELASAGGGGDSLLGELKRVFTENGWPFSEVAGAPVLVAELAGPDGRWDFYAHAVEEKNLVLLYSIAPQRVPEERRFDVSAFLTRANYGLADGNFELDFEDGEVRFKTVLHVHGDELDGLLVKRVVRASGLALETYLPTIGSVIAGTAGA
ncbi:MAG: YbjN domain-containing protein [Gaiellaceae bacterium]